VAADWQQVKGLFDEAMALSPGERRDFVLDITADEAVRSEVMSLLAHADDTDDSLGVHALGASPAAALANAAAPAAGREGQRVGAWLITGTLGTGGMGEVLRARRADGAYEGEAAIKLLKRGMDSAALLQRFAQEQRALGRMNHPNIARLFDAGLTADHQPYFVMELVDGEPIDRAAQGQPIERRLALFLQLADAVAHAHRQLLVHRDLKPSNVLVDRRGLVKLLDFGIAKALEGDGGDVATTQHGQRPFTPLYASPEQVRGEPVGTATDIYSLGVLLYVLLTGQRPYGRSASTPIEAARAVLEEEPTRPSALTPGLAADPQWLATRGRLRGDLDNILLKALDKRVERRYHTVEALASDIHGYLGGFPISARPASAAYQLQKFVARHRWAVLAGALGTLGLATGLAAALLNERVALALGSLGLTGGLGLALLQAREAARARDLAQTRLAQVQGLLRNLVAGHAEALANIPGAFTAREAMLAEAATNLDRIAAQAGLDRQMLATLGGAFSRLADAQGNVQAEHTGKFDQARANAERALRDFEAAQPRPEDPPEQHRWHARAFSTLARLERAAGRPEAALALFQRGERTLRDALPVHRGAGAALLREALASVVGDIGQTYDTQGLPNLDRPELALAAFDEANRLFESVAAERPLAEVLFRRAMMLGSQAVVYEKHDDLAAAIERVQAAERLAAEAVRVGARPDTTHQFNLVIIRHNLGEALLRAQRPEEALAAMTQCWHGIEELVRDNPGTATWPERRWVFALGFGRALAAAGRREQAEAVLVPLVEHWGGDADATAQRRAGLALLALAQCAADQGDFEAAQAWADDARGRFARGIERQPGERNLRLYEARALAALLRVGAADAAQLRGRAEQRYAEADAMSPLAADDRRDRDRLDAP
jgi:tetratricopeptide (TPR) repeat protein